MLSNYCKSSSTGASTGASTGNQISGILPINKPKGWTSFDVVKKVRGMLRAPKVGHTGTLDPMATGVLVLCMGSATKQVDQIMGMDKEYIGEVTLGATSNTDDAEGEITATNSNPIARADIEAALPAFIGHIDQLPPDFSAKKVEGERAYKAARQGKPLALTPQKVTVHALEILACEWPRLTLRIHCGKGFYVRALARDLGQKLNVGGYLSALQRTRVGKYALKEAILIEEITAEKVIPVFF